MSSSLAETSFDYEGVVWTCALLPYRIIACRDAIQYIVQIRNEKAYRNLSYFSDWEPIERHYPQLAMAGLPLNSPEVLSHEVKRRVMRLGNEPAIGGLSVADINLRKVCASQTVVCVRM